MKSINLTFSIITIALFAISLVDAINTYETSNGIIWVRDINTNLKDLNNLSKKVFEIKDNVCYIKKPIHITYDASLFVNNKSCEIVKLYPQTYIRIAGEIYFRDVKVTSYDPYTGREISITKDFYYNERPHIYTKAPAKYFSAINTEFSYLGYYVKGQEGSRWGIGLYDLKRARISNSNIHHNYFGVYTFNTKDLIVSYSEIHDNLEYGLDFHDYSENYLIYKNKIYNNGNHAVIFSKWCKNNKVVENEIYDNTSYVFVKGTERNYGTHGIMLHHFSENNLIEGNILRNNRIGIYLMDSDNNIVQDNIIENDLEEGIYVSRSDNNLFKNNNVLSSNGYSLYSNESDNNKYENNSLANGLYTKGDISQETENVAITQESQDLEVENLESVALENETDNNKDNLLKTKLWYMGVIFFIGVLGISAELIFTNKFRKKAR